MKAKILNSRQKKKMLDKLHKKYALDSSELRSLVFYADEREVWVAAECCLKQNLQDLNIQSIGLKLLSNGKPTIAAIQAFFKEADKTQLSEIEGKLFIETGKTNKKGKIMAYRDHPINLK
ncbi:MAG: hypothetical protein GF334_06655 [Candidatus Altiarchaeales archaeon]|nr:hypothetical protein [Candidatus Altiarchaeales archaeon]